MPKRCKDDVDKASAKNRKKQRLNVTKRKYIEQ